MESCQSQIVIDHHCHSLLKDFRHLDKIAFRQCVSETRSAYQLENHMASSLYYQEMLSNLARLFNLPARTSPADTEACLLELRSAHEEADYLNQLWDDVSLGALIVDDGFNSHKMMPLTELTRLSGRPVFQCRRIESVLEACLGSSFSFDELENNFARALFEPHSVKTVALKTIAAYRGGLELNVVSRLNAIKEFDNLKSQSEENGLVRCARNPAYHYLLLSSFELAGQHDMPVQIHSGFGDDDLDLRKANPVCFQNVLRAKTYSGTRFVMLHSYPFIKEAAYLSSIYGHVYMDLSLTIILLSPIGHNLVKECLASAPVSKIMAASDGNGVPEAHWWGARVWKRSLDEALYDLEKSGRISACQSGHIASRILHENARLLYGLDQFN